MIYYKEICSVECVCVFCMLLVAVASVAVLVGAGGGADDRQVLFYSRFTFLENITQIEHKFPIVNSAFCSGYGIDSLTLCFV